MIIWWPSRRQKTRYLFRLILGTFHVRVENLGFLLQRKSSKQERAERFGVTCVTEDIIAAKLILAIAREDEL